MADLHNEIDFNLFLGIIEQELGKQGVEIIELHLSGMGNRKIAKTLDTTYHNVGKILETCYELGRKYYEIL